MQAQVLEPATNATGTSLPARLLVTGVLGALLGALIGAIVVLAIGRSDRRLRERDEIADAIGVPVLASISCRVTHPAPPAGPGCSRTTSPEPSMRGACATPCTIWVWPT